jgi:hypothetical protein
MSSVGSRAGCLVHDTPGSSLVTITGASAVVGLAVEAPVGVAFAAGEGGGGCTVVYCAAGGSCGVQGRGTAQQQNNCKCQTISNLAIELGKKAGRYV